MRSVPRCAGGGSRDQPRPPQGGSSGLLHRRRCGGCLLPAAHAFRRDGAIAPWRAASSPRAGGSRLSRSQYRGEGPALGVAARRHTTERQGARVVRAGAGPLREPGREQPASRARRRGRAGRRAAPAGYGTTASSPRSFTRRWSRPPACACSAASRQSSRASPSSTSRPGSRRSPVRRWCCCCSSHPTTCDPCGSGGAGLGA